MKNIKERSAVIYCRTATKESDTKKRVAEQESKCRIAAECYGMRVIKVIKDIGKSGSNTNRPGLKNIIRLVKSKKINAIYVADQARLSRNTSDFLRLLDLFRKNHVAMRTPQEITLDLAQKYIKSTYAIFLEMHRKNQSELIKRGLARRRQLLAGKSS